MTSSNAGILNDFTKKLYESEYADSLPSEKNFKKLVCEFISDLPEVDASRKNSGGRVSTKPGAVYDADLCRCRVWNKGFAKQCSSKKLNGDYCKMHFTKISDYGGWSYGHYDEEAPTEHLFDGAGKTTKGNKINWKSIEDLPVKKEISEEVKALKKEYEEKLGKKPSGPKTNDAEWLQTKIDEHESGSDSETKKSDKKKKAKKKSSDKKKKKSKKKEISPEVKAMKEEYEKKLGKKPLGPKANDLEWLKEKIAEFEEESSDEESSDEEIEESEEEEEVEEDKVTHPPTPSIKKKSDTKKKKSDTKKEESDEEEETSGIKPLQLDLDDTPVEFEFEGVQYTRKMIDGKWIVEDDDENAVGEWKEKIPGDKDDAMIEWEDECWEEIHRDHDDYNGSK